MAAEVRVFAPATVANLGPGFDHLGVAVTGAGDTVTVRLSSQPGIRLITVTGHTEGLPAVPDSNLAVMAAREALADLEHDCGLEIELHKGLPVGSGLGGSAASAVASAYAVVLLLGTGDKHQALQPALRAEASVSGYHADNVVPCLFGGMMLVHGDGLEFTRIPSPRDLYLVLATPRLLLATRRAREVLPESVALSASSSNSARLGAMIAAAFQGQTLAFAQAVRDDIVEPVRAQLIPGFHRVKEAALETGALACSISGAGPTVFAIVDSRAAGERVGQAMVRAFRSAGTEATHFVAKVDPQGARKLNPG